MIFSDYTIVSIPRKLTNMTTLNGMVVDVTNPVYDYNWLCNMMRSRAEVVIVSKDRNYRGIINGIVPEDGSGKNWLVTITSTSSLKTYKDIFVKAM